MAKRPLELAVASDQPVEDRVENISLPSSNKLNTTKFVLPVGTVLHRIHQKQYQPEQFNPGIRGNARFSPIKDADENPIPTLYAGVTKDCALMETVFHDVPFTPGFKTVDKTKILDQVYSELEVITELELLDLASVALRKLGISRTQLIDSEKEQYPYTRKWAEALYSQSPQAQGLSWISRQDDTARSVMLFGDRVAVGSLRSNGETLSLIDDPDTRDDVLDLATRLGVLIVPGRG